MRQRIELDIAYSRLLRSGEQLSTALNPDQLKENLAEELPRMEINNAFISQYVDADLSQLVPFFCLRQGLVFDPGVGGFPASQLLPPGSDFEGQRRNWFLLPLTFEAEPLGVAVLEFGSGLTVYEMLREQIGTALNNIALHAEIVQKTALHERSVQERLAATDRMQSLSVLAGGVAHDLNNALGPLVALPDVIIADLDALFRNHALDIAAIKADLLVMKSASLRAARTIKDLLTLGRQGHTAKECLDVNVSVANWFNNESVPSNSKVKRHARVSLDLASEPLTILASESHIVRAVSNLVRNAMEAVEGDGEIVVKTYRCVLRDPFTGFEPIDSGDYVVLSVSDTGKGIAKHDMPHVFEPFFSKKRLDDGSGSGLGLAIVHGVVKEHNGYVDVESNPGHGARFSLYFRRVEASIAPVEHSTVTLASCAKILLVDDDPVQLRTASRVLGRLGHVVTAIDSGVRARTILFSSAGLSVTDGVSNDAPNTLYDVVIMDMLLNEADNGLTVFEKMHSGFPLLRGIIASGHSPTDRTALAVSRGLTWLAKPYTAEALARSVQIALSSPPHRRT